MNKPLEKSTNILEPLKVKGALMLEKMRLRLMKNGDKIEENIFDYVIIESLKKQVPMNTELETINRDVGISGEHDVESNILCGNCKQVVGDYGTGTIYFKYCPNCGQLQKKQI